MGEEILTTSQRACTVRAYLDWRSMKHQGVSELHISASNPHEMGCLSPPLSLVRFNNYTSIILVINAIVGASSNTSIMATFQHKEDDNKKIIIILPQLH